MNCIVIDDEPLARQGMELLINDVDWLTLSGQFSNVVDAAGFLKTNKVDLIFLDIQMPRMTGLDFLKSGHIHTPVIITTAYPQFAVEAFELNVTDYLVKPIRFERFFKAISKLKESGETRNALSSDDDYVFIRTERKFVRVSYNDIDYVEGLKDYVIVHCGTEKHMVATNLKSILAQLPENIFIRVNKSNLVNISKVRSIDNDHVHINNEQLSIGETFKKDLLSFISSKKNLKRL